MILEHIVHFDRMKKNNSEKVIGNQIDITNPR